MPECPTPLPECLERLKNIDEKLSAVYKAVLGNGNPHASLDDRVVRLETGFKIFGMVLVIAGTAVGALLVALISQWVK